MFKRWQTKQVNIGNVKLGNGNPIIVQSMTNTDTRDVNKTVQQIMSLENLGCEIVRVAVPDIYAAQKLGEIKRKIHIPLVADIHFDYKLALEAIKQGVDKLRINPGNIGSKQKVQTVVQAAKKAKIPIRIGVNSGSLKSIHNIKDISKKANLIVNAALEHVKILESLKFYDIVVSLKASNIQTTLESYRLFATKRNYALHLGITESGTVFSGTIKSSVGLAILLNEGLGDTIRVSLTSNPETEVKVAYKILQYLGLRSQGIEIISCPTCARCKVDLIKITNDLEDKISLLSSQKKRIKPLKIAVMGCIVNGPGEAKESDLGIAGGGKFGLVFRKGKIIKKVSSDKWVSTLLELIQKEI